MKNKSSSSKPQHKFRPALFRAQLTLLQSRLRAGLDIDSRSVANLLRVAP